MGNKKYPSKLGLLSVILIITIGAAGAAYASGGATGPTWWGIPQEKLWDLLWRAVNFAVLLIILVKFGSKPIGNMLKGRQLAIKEEFETLEAKKAEADEAYRGVEEKLSGVDQEVKKILETAVAQGEAEKERIITEAKRAADDIKRQAEMAILHEIADTKLLLREEVANQAILMAEELVKKNLQPGDQDKLVEDYLEKVGAIQ